MKEDRNKVNRCRPIKLQELKCIRSVSLFLFLPNPIITEHEANNLVMVELWLTSIINSTLHIHSALKSESHVNRSLNPTIKSFVCFSVTFFWQLWCQIIDVFHLEGSWHQLENRRKTLKWQPSRLPQHSTAAFRSSSLFLNWSSS